MLILGWHLVIVEIWFFDAVRLDFESLMGILLSLKLGLDIDDDGAEPVPLGIKEPPPIRAEPDPFLGVKAPAPIEKSRIFVSKLFFPEFFLFELF